MNEGLDYTYEAPTNGVVETQSPQNQPEVGSPTYDEFQTYLRQLEDDGEPPEVIDYWIALWLEQRGREEAEALRKV